MSKRFSNNSKNNKNNNNKRGKDVVRLFPKKQRWEKDRQDIRRLNEEIAKIPERSLVYSSQIKNFFDLPISQKTLIGLKDAGFMQPTEIQRESLGLALRGLDILGAAKTGSGKTLAFVIPILELLYRNEWTHFDRIGALIISPSREVAMQTFNTIKSVGKKHDFSLGLFIGGQGYNFEKDRLGKINIFVGTPGRVLHHMSVNHLMDCTNLKILVLDEADQILESSFAKEIDAIIENLPQERQTLLFSATQTKSVKDLARLSLRDPVYVSVHENASAKTPDGLIQNYVICELHEKFNFLWSFIKKNLKKKTLVFMTTCKQVKFTYEAICRLRPGVSVLALYGGMNQDKRIDVYNQFCNKYNVVLLATDLASRGLDFPEVNWVVQMDCPEDPTSYIHRVGRTARYEKSGCALLMLLPSEEAMVTKLTEQRIPISRIQVNPKNQLNVMKKLEILSTQFVEFKEKTQRAVVDYVKAYYVKSDKSVFDVTKLNVDALSRSLGLATAPRIRAIEKKLKSQNKSFANQAETKMNAKKPIDSDESESETEDKSKNSSPIKSKLESYNFGYDSDGDDDDQLFTLKRKHPFTEDKDEVEELLSNKKKKLLAKPLSKAKTVKKLLNKNIKANTKIKFDDDGEVIVNPNMRISEAAAALALTSEGGIDIENSKLVMMEQDKLDKEIYRQRIKAEKLTKKLRKKEKARKRRQEEDEKKNENDENSPHEDEWSSGDESPDLDFLPDPDKVYADKKAKSAASASDNESDEEIDEHNNRSESENNSDNEVEDSKSSGEEIDEDDENSENNSDDQPDDSSEGEEESENSSEGEEEQEVKKLTKETKSLPKQRHLFKNRSLPQKKKSVNYTDLSLQDSESLALQLLNKF